MAIEYQLKFSDGVEPSALAGWLRAAGFEDTSAPATLLAPGLSATIVGVRDRGGRWTALGFVPRIEVFFGQDKFAPYEATVTRLVEAVALLLREVPVDAALAGDNEVVLALRLQGRLVLTSRDDWWTRPASSPRLAEWMGEVYRLKLLPIL